MKSFEQFVCLSGLPRAGSTLLSSILSQNPDICAEGTSSVCPMMLSTKQSCAREEITLSANNRTHVVGDLISSVPNIYYRDVSTSIVVDKNRSWVLPENVQMLRQYIGEHKIIVLERPLVEIVKSFVNLAKENGLTSDEEGYLRENSNPIMIPFRGIEWAKQNNNGEFLFVTYDELVSQTKDVLDRIYTFCSWSPFEHDLENIVNKYPENDEFYNLKGMHDVRPTISRREINVNLLDSTIERCKELGQ